MEEEDKRNLTDADIRALVDELENRFEKRFYLNLGKGIWSIAWKVVVAGVLILAAVGSFKGDRFF